MRAQRKWALVKRKHFTNILIFPGVLQSESMTIYRKGGGRRDDVEGSKQWSTNWLL